MKFTLLTDFDAESLESAAEKLAVIQSIANDSLVLVEDEHGLLLVQELRQLGINIKAACLGHLEKRLLSVGDSPGKVN